jgi:hypothetical protein
MEVSWHPGQQLVIVSLWNGPICRATFQMPAGQVPVLVEALSLVSSDDDRSPHAEVKPALLAGEQLWHERADGRATTDLWRHMSPVAGA